MERVSSMSLMAAGILVFFVPAVAVFSGGAARGEETELTVVGQVDVARYAGTWYEIAAIPASFQKACVGGTTADYTILPGGEVEVLNQCYERNGKLKKAKGRARVVDDKTNAKLKVSFIPWLQLDFLSGDYWIIDLGPDYEYAVVGHPDRAYGWILSRTPELPEATLAGIKERLEKKGYDFSRFRMTEQKEYADRVR